MAVQLKYLSNFQRNFEMPLTNCEINLVLIWSENCLISTIANAKIFAIPDLKNYVVVVNLSTQDNEKLS